MTSTSRVEPCRAGGAALLHHAEDDVIEVRAGTDGLADSDQASGDTAFLRAVDGLALAAAPTLALMACLAGLVGNGPMAMSCPAAHDASPLSSMAVMYGLMSVFHAGPWLRLLARRRPRGNRP